jgi:hypothetical protein
MRCARDTRLRPESAQPRLTGFDAFTHNKWPPIASRGSKLHDVTRRAVAQDNNNRADGRLPCRLVDRFMLSSLA